MSAVRWPTAAPTSHIDCKICRARLSTKSTTRLFPQLGMIEPVVGILPQKYLKYALFPTSIL